MMVYYENKRFFPPPLWGRESQFSSSSGAPKGKVGDEIKAKRLLKEELEKTRAEMYQKVPKKQALIDKLKSMSCCFSGKIRILVVLKPEQFVGEVVMDMTQEQYEGVPE